MILTVTLNPAVDKTYQTGELLCGRVNRMRSSANLAGGKGINVSKILRQYGYETAATGFLGGYPGQWIASRLEKMGIREEFIRTEEDTRSSINVVADNGYVTELLEPGPHISAARLEEFMERFALLSEECSLVIVSGSAPRGIPEDIYARLIRTAKRAGKEIILDASGELLREGLTAAPSLVKPNRKELEYVVGHRLRDREDLKAAAELLQRNGVERAVVTLGEKGILLAGRTGCLYAAAPKVKAENTVGCGDSVAASLAMSLLAGQSEEEMLRRAAAISAASATTLESGSVPVQLAEELYRDIVVEEI